MVCFGGGGIVANAGAKKQRRGRGEGSIVWLDDRQVWFGRISSGKDEDGKRIVKAFYSKKNGKKSEVTKKMAEWRKENEVGAFSESSELLEDKMLLWLEVIKKPALKSASYDRLESTINNHIIPSIGDIKLCDLTPVLIQNMVINKMMLKLGHSSVIKAYDALNSYLKYAVSNKDILFNPMTSVSKPSKSHFDISEIEIISDEDIKKMAGAISATHKNGTPIYRYGHAYILALNTGIRLGEAIALKWDDVDLERKTISIKGNAIIVKTRAEKEAGEGKTTLKIQSSAKSRSGTRAIPLNKAAINSLNELGKVKNCEFVVSTKQGKPVHPAPFQKTLDRICERAGINRFGTHALRHTFASKLIEAGVDIKVVSKILGHSSVRITYDTYVHILEKHKQSAVDAIDFM